MSDPLAKLVVRAALLLRPRGAADPCPSLERLAAADPGERRYLSHQELEDVYGASPDDVAAVEAFAGQHGLEVVEVNRAGRLIVLRSTLEKFASSLRCEIEEHPQAPSPGRYHRPAHPVEPPAELTDIVEGIFGLDNLPRFVRHDRFHVAVLPDRDEPSVDGERSGASSRPKTRPEEVLRHYRFPGDVTGRGQRIAVLLLGGGFYEDDVEAYFAPRKPRVDVVEVGGATNAPAPREAVAQFLKELRSGRTPSADEELRSRIWWTLEATVDVELAASFAPGADVVVYFANNDELGKIEGLTAVLTDTRHDPQVLSCSWGAAEAELDAEFVRSTDRIFQLAALSGMSVCYASGDKGPRTETGRPTPDFPAASPHVLSCGGTALATAEPERPESVWNESRGRLVLTTGGGFSDLFARPAWQQGVPAAPDGQARRGVPDVAAKADYAAGYDLLVAGQRFLGGGTSSAAPLWAGLLARFNEALGTRSGWVTPLLYASRFRDGLTSIDVGGNGVFEALPGWDACTGLGTPKAEELLRALTRDAAR